MECNDCNVYTDDADALYIYIYYIIYMYIQGVTEIQVQN